MRAPGPAMRRSRSPMEHPQIPATRDANGIYLVGANPTWLCPHCLQVKFDPSEHAACPGCLSWHRARADQRWQAIRFAALAGRYGGLSTRLH